ncbi:MAG: CPBP family intramembrane metalloprotease, partial [Halioglobus sp.]|nr:CPBP family intramembrane metalloprotease [Halioglobus sp.]
MRLEFWSVLVFLAASDLSTPANAGTNPAPLMWFACPSAASLLLYLIVMSGITPVTEEIVHRGWLLPWLLPYGRWTAVVASAALFAVLHTWSG